MTKSTRPVPVAIKKLKGNPGRRKHEIENKPAFEEGEFNLFCPSDLSEVGAAKWAELAPMLNNAGVLSQGDRDMLAQFCRYWEISMECLGDQRRLGASIDAGGRMVQAPWTKTLLQLAPILERHLVHFGLSPTARGKVTVIEKNKSVDPKDRFFN
jgi:P27 family predicted phage terminase small subunit